MGTDAGVGGGRSDATHVGVAFAGATGATQPVRTASTLAVPATATLNVALPPARGRTSFWLRMRAGYSFALWLLPGLIAGASVALYVLGQNVLRSKDGTTGELVSGIPDGVLYTVGGTIIGLAAWTFLSWLAGRYCTAAVANGDEYHKLAGRLSAIDATLSKLPMPAPTATQQLIAVEQAVRDRDRAIAWLSWDGPDQQWAFGDLYVASWRYVHAAEEALMDILPAPIILADAQMSLLRLNGSPIGDRETLKNQVTHAIAAFGASGTGTSTQAGAATGSPGPAGAATAAGAAETASTVEPAAGTSAASSVGVSGATTAATIIGEDAARAALRAAKSAINDFRDGRSDQLVSLGRKVRVRHVALSVIVALLFEMGILALDPQYHLVEAFAVYFLVGALAGIALEAQRSKGSSSTTSQDYGLNRERLFLTFSMAGAAACGGIILFVMLLGTTVSDLFSSAPTAFKPEVVAISPVLILVAAAFGLAPSRLFTAVTGLAEQILIQSDLSSTTPTGGGSSGAGGENG